MENLYPQAFGNTFSELFFFRAAWLPARATFIGDSYPMGKFIYSFSGVLEIESSNASFVITPQFGIWIPPNVGHSGFNRHQAYHCSFHVASEHCIHLPSTACALTVTPLVRAILEELRLRLVHSPEEDRLLYVLLDLLARSSRAESYLPTSCDPLLGPVLRALEAFPADPRSLPEFACSAKTTERTMMRRCQRDLGMTFIEWRQRLKIIEAMVLLEKGQAVEEISLKLGYSTASAFICMFRRMMGASPDEYRKNISLTESC